MNPPHTPTSLSGQCWGQGSIWIPASWALGHPAIPGYLPYKLPPSPPPTWLHSDDDALSQPVLGGSPSWPCCLLCLQLDAQPALQLCDEPLLGWGPAQGGGVQPAARGGLPGHGVSMARLPTPPDHGADLGAEGEVVTVPCGQDTMPLNSREDRAENNCQARAKLRGVDSGQARLAQEYKLKESPLAWNSPPTQPRTLGKTLNFQGLQSLHPQNGFCFFFWFTS
jgi:hypothetical protein